MTKIKITTTQNIDIEYELATIFDRMLAWLVDFIVILGYVMIAWVLASAIWGDPAPPALTAFIVPAFFYHLLSESLMNGQSLGKMALRIRVVRLDGSPPNAGNYLMRWMFRLLETSPLVFYGTVGVVSIAFSDKGQRIGDALAGTTVIRTQRRTGLSDTIFARTKADYEPLFPAVERLNDRDLQTIRDVMRAYRREGNVKLLNACANRVCHVLDIVPPKNMNALQFLRSLIRDYSHLS